VSQIAHAANSSKKTTTTACRFRVGDRVLVYDLCPTASSKWHHGTIVSVLGGLLYTVTCEGHQRQSHLDQLLPAGSAAVEPSELLLFQKSPWPNSIWLR